MAGKRCNRLQVGSSTWIAQERSCALQIAQAETEEFTFSVQNEVDWLNEHMAEIFSTNEMSIANVFKTPGKLRGRTPKTGRKNHLFQQRPPLSNIFSATPTIRSSPSKHLSFENLPPTFSVTEDDTVQDENNCPKIDRLDITPVPRTVKNPKSTSNDDQKNVIEKSCEHIAAQSQSTQDLSQSLDREEPYSNTSIAKDNLNKFGNEYDHTKFIAEAPKYPELHSLKASYENSHSGDNLQRDSSAIDKDSLYPVLKLSDLIEPDRSLNPPNSALKISSANLSPQLTNLTEQNLPESHIAGQNKNQINDANSPSDGSSPIRPIVRKSSLNFASLPAREPITTKKSTDNRVSRISQIEQSRVSYFGRQTGEKSLENVANKGDCDDKQTELIEKVQTAGEKIDAKILRLYSKTSTQRLQDQISKLGQPQKPSFRSSNINSYTPQTQSTQPTTQSTTESTTESTAQHTTQSTTQSVKESTTESTAQSTQFTTQSSQPINDVILFESSQASKKSFSKSSLGDALGNDENSSVGCSAVKLADPACTSPQLDASLRYPAEIVGYYNEENQLRKTCSNSSEGEEIQFHMASPNQKQTVTEKNASSFSNQLKTAPESASRSSNTLEESLSPSKLNPASYPNLHVPFNNSNIPSKSPKTFRESPLKVAKDKFSSILKNSKVLFANSMATTIEEKVSTNSSSSGQVDTREQDFHGFHGEIISNVHEEQAPSILSAGDENLSLLQAAQNSSKINQSQKHFTLEEQEMKKEAQASSIIKESIDSSIVDTQIGDPNLETCIVACQQHDKQAKETHNSSTSQSWNSPRKVKPLVESERIAETVISSIEPSRKEDVETSDASYRIPSSAIRPNPQIVRSEKKRPVRPTRAAQKVKPPTFIRVDTGSQRGQQFHPSNFTLSSTLQESLCTQSVNPSQSLRHKASASSVQSKSSSSSFKSAATKTLEAAARKKEKDELAVARKREAKLEIERQRAAVKEEEHKKRQEAEIQNEIQREREKVNKMSDAKKLASRQAIEKRRLELEKSKENRPVPSNVRAKIIGDSEKFLPQVLKSEAGLSKVQKPQQDAMKAVNNPLNGNKAPPKRLFQIDTEDQYARPYLQRNGPPQQNDQQPKRRKTDDCDKDLDIDNNRPKMTAPPIRQSNIRHKDLPTKSIFSGSYVNTLPSSNLQRSTLISQHNLNQTRSAYPMDMTQLAKGPIPFAPSSSQGSSQPHKTPAHSVTQNCNGKPSVKPSTKSVAKSSPRYQNGDNIDLPEIPTDSEDENSEEETSGVRPGWTDTPEIHKQLAYQESIDPADVFGQPGPLNMEEVFSKSKDRFHKFRARTSSANWSGTDKLTEDEIKRDLEGRDRVRRQGGWTYDAMV